MYTAKQMIVMRRDLKMRKGKIAAQAGHACVEAVLAALIKENRLSQVCLDGDGITLKPSNSLDDSTPLCQWFKNGVAKICVYVDSEEQLLEIDKKAKDAGIISSLICDAGMTEFHGHSTYTCLAFEPQLPEVVDPITGELPLF
jgi:PTH2 family peptidyl-tRNA hydrolase